VLKAGDSKSATLQTVPASRDRFQQGGVNETLVRLRP
jgi:hypothetical protein